MLRNRVTGWIVPFAFALCGVWPSLASANNDIDIVCPCKLEFSNLTSVSVSFGIRNLQTDRETPPLEARLVARKVEDDNQFYTVASTELPSVPANSTLPVQDYTVAFRTPYEGQYEFKLWLIGPSGWILESITWIADPVELRQSANANSTVYFDGTPTLAISDKTATIELPELKNQAGGQPANGLLRNWKPTRPCRLARASRIAEHELGVSLEPGAK